MNYHYYIILDNTASTKSILPYFEISLKEFLKNKRGDPYALEMLKLSLYLVSDVFIKINQQDELCDFSITAIQSSDSYVFKLVPVIKNIFSNINPGDRNYLLICLDGSILDFEDFKSMSESIKKSFKLSVGLGIGPIADTSALCTFCNGVFKDLVLHNRSDRNIGFEMVGIFNWFLNSIGQDNSADIDGLFDVINLPYRLNVKIIKEP